MISTAEATCKSLAKTLGLKLVNSGGFVQILDNDRTVFQFGNWIETSAFLLGVCWGEGRSSGKSIVFADWLKRMREGGA